jgi:hypothetical protein
MRLWTQWHTDDVEFVIVPYAWWLSKRSKDMLMIRWLKFEFHLHLRGA